MRKDHATADIGQRTARYQNATPRYGLPRQKYQVRSKRRQPHKRLARGPKTSNRFGERCTTAASTWQRFERKWWGSSSNHKRTAAAVATAREQDKQHGITEYDRTNGNNRGVPYHVVHADADQDEGKELRQRGERDALMFTLFTDDGEDQTYRRPRMFFSRGRAVGSGVSRSAENRQWEGWRGNRNTTELPPKLSMLEDEKSSRVLKQ